MGFIIRKATQEDAGLLREVALAVIAEYGTDSVDSLHLSDYDNIDERYNACGGCLWLLEVNGGISGAIGVLPDGHGGCEILQFFVAPARRKFGLGKELLKKAAVFALNCNYKSLWMKMHRDFSASLASLASLGFRQCEAPRYVRVAEYEVYIEM